MESSDGMGSSQRNGEVRMKSLLPFNLFHSLTVMRQDDESDPVPPPDPPTPAFCWRAGKGAGRHKRDDHRGICLRHFIQNDFSCGFICMY